ncbi:MAG: enoyl-CoA hydratase-related protein [Erysipelotrichaceae bacterium]|nr:enoyl-CoA hydratase-related protein [Erysipelotrichaceae bacterium]
MYSNIKVIDNNNYTTIVLNRPNALNALNGEMLNEVENVLDNELKKSYGLIITGEGRAFAAGADITLQKDFSSEEAIEWSKMGSAIFRKIELLDIPTIAAVNGYALGGGCELAMSCDMIFASQKAKFGQPEVSLGVTPGFSGTVRLPRLVGTAKAMELLISGEIIPADEAMRIGLVNRVYKPEELKKETEAFLEKVLSMGPKAVKNCKRLVRCGIDMCIEEAIMYENRLFGECYENGEGNEGMYAFVEKRNPDFMSGPRISI